MIAGGGRRACARQRVQIPRVQFEACVPVAALMAHFPTNKFVERDEEAYEHCQLKD
jgi:hypothetical protein